jgi:membrane glycosyltransferase
MTDTPNIEAVSPPRLRRGWRLFLFFTSALVLTGFVSLLFADLLWRTGWSASRTVLLVLFIILFLLTAIGCMHGVFGFFIRTFGTRRRITGLKNFKAQNIDGVSTAIIFPVYNEDSVRVLEGLRATYESLARAGQIGKFDFFILSDSTNPDRWVE